MNEYWDVWSMERDNVHLANRVDLPTGAKIHTVVCIDYGMRKATLEVEVEGPVTILMQCEKIISVHEAEAITGWSEETHEAEWHDIQRCRAEDAIDEARAEDRNRVQDHW